MLGIMVACLVIVGLLGTMAGGNAVIAPIVLPVAASLGLSRSTVGVIFQAVGEEALILGPFTPPVITLLGLTGISYGAMLLCVSGPIALITLTVTWCMLQRIRHRTRDSSSYELSEEVQQFTPTAVTGLAGSLTLDTILKLVVRGMAGNVGLFLLFLLLDPFISFVEKAGGFATFTTLLKPFMEVGGKGSIVITGGFLGAFGVGGATVAALKLLHEMFYPLLTRFSVSMVA